MSLPIIGNGFLAILYVVVHYRGMAETYAQQLDRVQTAIAAIETGGQSVSQNGRTLSRADLSTLYAREQRLLDLIDRQSNGSRTLAEF